MIQVQKGTTSLIPTPASLYKKQLSELSSALMQLYAFRIHLMAGRFPTGAKRDAVSIEMEATFIENLKYAADILEQVWTECKWENYQIAMLLPERERIPFNIDFLGEGVESITLQVLLNCNSSPCESQTGYWGLLVKLS